MKKIFILVIILLSAIFLHAQLGGNQYFSKELTEYRTKEYLVKEILNIPENFTIGVEVDAITASNSGELTAVIYDCPYLKKRGIVFVFWQDTWNEYNTKYKGYAFKNIEYEDAKVMFSKLSDVLSKKDIILNEGEDWNAVYLWKDIYYILYSYGTETNIRVLWNGFDSEWNQTNLERTSRRFTKSLN